MKRFFYTDPLAAAWMSRHFGMRFADSQGIALEWCGEFNCFHLPDDAELSQAFDGKHYIHRDSLHLLEPQVGDIVVRKADKYELADSVSAIDESGNLYTASLDTRRQWIGHKRGSKIIYRNGLAFHWPESEAV